MPTLEEGDLAVNLQRYNTVRRKVSNLALARDDGEVVVEGDQGGEDGAGRRSKLQQDKKNKTYGSSISNYTGRFRVQNRSPKIIFFDDPNVVDEYRKILEAQQ